MDTTAQTVKDSLGDRMKANYEDRARHCLARRTPVVVRVDGKAFHTFTRRCDKPYDSGLNDAMIAGAMAVAEEMQGFKLGYVQSDEASFLLTDYDRFETQPWFDYNKSKIESVAASCMTAHFNAAFGGKQVFLVSPEIADSTETIHDLLKARDGDIIVGKPGDVQALRLGMAIAMFDARSFNLPREEVANYFLWRAKDWERNSLSMYCQAFFSPKQLHGKGKAEQHDLLHGIGKNWTTDLEPRWRNGAWIIRTPERLVVRHDITPSFAEINETVDPRVNCEKDPETP